MLGTMQPFVGTLVNHYKVALWGTDTWGLLASTVMRISSYCFDMSSSLTLVGCHCSLLSSPDLLVPAFPCPLETRQPF